MKIRTFAIGLLLASSLAGVGHAKPAHGIRIVYLGDSVSVLPIGSAYPDQVGPALEAAGLTVGCLATPIFKWPAPGQPVENAGDQFGFDRRGRTDEEIYRDAFEAADLLGTRHLRIFTLLTYDGFKLEDLQVELQKLLRMAEGHDATLHVENEPVCNIRSVPDLVRLMEAWRHPRLKALLDIGKCLVGGNAAERATSWP
ncbi:MAG: TIM barrel protein [Rhodospirillales bacterium]|nr:TIM barrel protein [Rhodospirillales bacterium]